MVFVGEKYGVCGGTDGINSLEEGDKIGDRDGRDEVKGGGRCEGGRNSSAFGDSLLVGWGCGYSCACGWAEGS